MIYTITIIVIIGYMILIGVLSFGFDNVELFRLQDLKAKTKFSILIPFRNEAENLPELLDSIFSLNYPKDLFEVIFIDDQSEDASAQIINGLINERHPKELFNFKIIQNDRLSKSPKKDAINSAIAISKYDWLITTDADCQLPKYWLDAFDECIQNNALNCIAAPVTYGDNDSFFRRFQALDFLSLQAATIGGFGIGMPFLCNGANFAYRKMAFNEIDGFSGNLDIASGDDIFLLEKFKNLDAQKVAFLKSTDAIVTTKPVTTLDQLIQQRLRWASKTSRNPNVITKLVGGIVLSANLVFAALSFLWFFNFMTLKTVIALFVIKFAIDLLLLFKAVRFFRQETLLSSYIFSSLLYPFFSVYIVLLSLFQSYRWKGRSFKK